jgi:predicted  nucleic acid-binding Zn-ribbon protein
MDAMATQNMLVEIHEDRIQMLEEKMNEFNSRLAQLSTQQEHMSNTLDSVREDVEQKMEEGFASVKEEVQKTGAKIDKLHEVVQKHDQKIQSIETANEQSDKRWSLIAKVTGFIVAAIVGAALNNLVDHLMK